MPEAHAPRVLVLLSADFGELANAMVLLDGTEVCARLLLPPRLYAHNPHLPPHRVAAYSGVADLIAEMRHWRPQCVLLLSAYLYGVNGLLDQHELEQILDEVRALGADVATTDPFLGALPGPSAKAFSPARGDAALHHFVALRELLRDVPHVYLSPLPEGAAVRSFFNPRLLISSGDKEKSLAGLAQGPLRLDAPYWLFILSNEDYRIQCGAKGKTEFEAMLLGMLQDGHSAGRRVVLIAPPEAAESLEGRTPASARVMPFCDYLTFHALLLNAEHAFYWNVLSNSVLLRAANGGSVFFMDTGHLARYVPSIFPLAMQSYYSHAPLPMLDPTEALDAETLTRLAQLQPETFAAALAALHALPTPDELLASLSGATSR